MKASPKILYVGTLDREGTCYSRLCALQSMGLDVHSFDTDFFFNSVGRQQWRLEIMTFFGPRYRKANQALLQRCSQLKPDIVWIDKATWIWPKTLKRLRLNGLFLVQYNTDSLYPRDWRVRWSYLLQRMILCEYNIYFTSNLIDHHWLSKKSLVRVELTYIGYDNIRFTNTPLTDDLAKKWEAPLLFVGHYEASTENWILSLIDAGLPVKVYGWGWNHARQKNRLVTNVEFRRLDNGDYIHALKAAKIGLCFVSTLNGNQTAGRSFEIPACGTFLLGVRTPQHLECYKEGVEAEFFDSTSELVKKAYYYLENDSERNKIAVQGHIRCIKSDYSWGRFTRDNWQKVLDAYTSKLKVTNKGLGDFHGGVVQ